MDELWKAALPKLVEVGLPLAVTVLTTLFGMVLNALRRRINHQAADSALARLERVVMLTVHEVEQTIVPELRAAAEDGVITPDEAAHLRLTAMAKAKSILGDKGMKELKASAGDLEQLLRAVIESKVREMRLNQSTPPAA